MDATPLPADAASAMRSPDVGSESASVQAIPATLAGLLEQHGSDPGADSRTRIRPSLTTCLVHDLQVGIGMGLALTAVILVGPTPHAVWNAFGFGLASAMAVLALGRPGRAQGRVDLVITVLLAVALAAAGGIGTGVQPLGGNGTGLLEGAILMAGLLLALAGLHAGGGLAARIGRVAAPLAPLAAALAVV